MSDDVKLTDVAFDRGFCAGLNHLEAQLAAAKADRDRVLAMLEPSEENAAPLAQIMVDNSPNSHALDMSDFIDDTRAILTYLHTQAKDGE